MINCYNHDLFDKKKIPLGWFNNLQSADRKLIERINGYIFSPFSIQPWSESEKDFIKNNLWLDDNNHWFRYTGVKPEKSIFAICIPVHNEASFLPAMLGTILLSHLPKSAKITFLIITNGCTDNGSSQRIIFNFMSLFGEVQKKDINKNPLANKFTDEKIDKSYFLIDIDNIKFIHLNTNSAGKAYAINIANEIALKNNDPILINLDANVFIEPNSFAKMYVLAYEKFIHKPDNTAIIAGDKKADKLPPISASDEFFQKEFSGLNAREILPIIHNQLIPMHGAFMSWNPKSMLEEGGMPHTAVEDDVFAYRAVFNGKKVIKASGAVMWKVEPFTLKSRIIFLSRIIRGWLQAIEQFPYLKSFIKTQVSYMKDSRNGVIYADLKEWQKQNQKISEQTLLAIFQLWSKVYLTGVEEFKKRRFDCSWDDVPGTK